MISVSEGNENMRFYRNFREVTVNFYEEKTVSGGWNCFPGIGVGG